jgi:hypothetical protein
LAYDDYDSWNGSLADIMLADARARFFIDAGVK